MGGKILYCDMLLNIEFPDYVRNNTSVPTRPQSTDWAKGTRPGSMETSICFHRTPDRRGFIGPRTAPMSHNNNPFLRKKHISTCKSN